MNRSALELDRLTRDAARAELTRCCGAWRWVEEMLERRPFESREAVLRASDEVWATMGPGDWLEAFAHHPRIGERRAAAHDDSTAAAWSSEEQSAATSAGADLRRRLAEANEAYEHRFGHIFIVFAPGLGADEILAIMESRMRNDAQTELRVAAEEQRKITRRRLERVLDEGGQ